MKAYKHTPGRNIPVSSCVFVAETFFQRLSGLVLRRPLIGDEALLIRGCRSIHTHWMRYSLDVVFIDREGKTTAVFEDMKPWRSTPFIDGASDVLEFRAGLLKAACIDIGDRIIFQ